MSLSENRRQTSDPLVGAPQRLTYRTMRTLSVISAHPGLSNRQISQRTGIKDKGQISKLLTRLRRQGLIENASGEKANRASNAWRLTREGTVLERCFEAAFRPSRTGRAGSVDGKELSK